MVTKAEKSARLRAQAEAARLQEEAQQRRRLIFILIGAGITAVVIALIFISSSGVFGGGYGGVGPKATPGVSQTPSPSPSAP